MNFLEPLFLVGLLAAALPLAVHLFNRKKAVRRPFPAMTFLLQSNTRTARSAKVRQWMLMALRMGALALLAMAMAKPFCLDAQGISQDARMPSAVVIVVDTSASMRRDGWWERAKNLAQDELDALRPWDQVVLLSTGRLDDPDARLSDAHAQAAQALDELEPTWAAHDLNAALERASGLLASTQLPARRVVLISDFSASARSDKQGSVLPASLEKKSVRAEGQATQNIEVVGVTYVQEDAQKNLWRIDAQLKNHGDEDARDVQLQLRVKGEVVSGGAVDVLAARASATHTFRHTYEGTGVVAASVELLQDDDYAPDNVRHVALRMRDRIRTLVVNGEPGSISYDDEVFFLTRALNPTRDKSRGIVPVVVNPTALISTDLSEYDVVFLSNLPRVSADIVTKLKAYVEGGGGLFITMGDQVDVEAYNKTLKELLPKPLRGLKKLAELDDPDAPIKVTHLGATDTRHPIFRAFSLPGGHTLQTTQVFSYMLLEPTIEADSKTIMSFKDNAPALLERKVGRGRVLLWTSSIDREWTDFPVRSTYLPLLQRAVTTLARRATNDRDEDPVVGAPLPLELPDDRIERVVIVGPQHIKDPTRLVLEPIEGNVTPTPSQPGLYRVWANSAGDGKDGNELTGLSFVAQSPASESDFAPMATDALASWTPSEGASDGEAMLAKKRVNIWPKILFVITMLLLLETVLGTRRSVLQKIWRGVRGA